MMYYTLRYHGIANDVFTRSKSGRIMLFPSREDAEMYRDAYYGREGVHTYRVVELEVERAEDKPNSYQLMTAIHAWESRQAKGEKQ